MLVAYTCPYFSDGNPVPSRFCLAYFDALACAVWQSLMRDVSMCELRYDEA